MAYVLLMHIPSGVNRLLEIYEHYITKLGKNLIASLGNTVAKVGESDTVYEASSKFVTDFGLIDRYAIAPLPIHVTNLIDCKGSSSVC
jgi:hypothetical protein